MTAYSTSKPVLSCTCPFRLNQIMSLNMKSHWHSPTWTPQRISKKSILLVLSSEIQGERVKAEIKRDWMANQYNPTTPISMIWEDVLRKYVQTAFGKGNLTTKTHHILKPWRPGVLGHGNCHSLVQPGEYLWVYFSMACSYIQRYHLKLFLCLYIFNCTFFWEKTAFHPMIF